MTILITGAAQGIGASMAKLLATPANVLILTDLQSDKLNEFIQSLPPTKKVIAVGGDITQDSVIQQLGEVMVTESIDVLINNAGISNKLNLFEALTVDELDLSYKINVRAPFLLIQSALRVMKSKTSSMIINVASRANIYGYYRMAAYSASKAAVTALAGTVALENPNIKAITLIPGRTNTPMQANLRGTDEAMKAQSPDYVAEVLSKLISGEIQTESGNSVIVDFGAYKIVTELDRNDLHKNMH